MSDISYSNPTSPIQTRDIRSASKPFKRDRDHDQKWVNGVRPLNVHYKFSISNTPDGLDGGSDQQEEKVRPMKQWSQVYTPPIPVSISPTNMNRNTDHKSHANRSPKNASLRNVSHTQDGISGRLTKKVDAEFESTTAEPLSKSLLELLPQHRNNTMGPVQVALSGDEGVLYSYDKRPSPNARGREVDLGGLIDQAERKWESEQTEQMVKDYEVLDLTGEAVKIKKGKRGSRSPRNRAVKNEIVATPIEEVDGFELI